ncbi:MAG: hypothetical protein IH931_08250 [candidate division Zixibacteria bacterium]|nr:hypothetical protein [candidate division Zixibacteria bacterium]
MRKSKLILTVMSLLLLFASFLSVPALSGENPWDADDGNTGSPGVPADSAEIDAGPTSDSPTGLVPGTPSSSDNKLGWFSGIMTRLSGFVVNSYYKWTSPKAQVKTAY